MLRYTEFITEGEKFKNEHLEKVLHKHGWEVSDTDGSGNEASYYHETHPNHFVHTSHGKWSHTDDDDDLVKKGATHHTLDKHLQKFHKEG